MNFTFTTSNGSIMLRRRPARHDKSLQAWDAADEYLLQVAHELAPAAAAALAINDQFGALTLGLGAPCLCSWGDSRTAHLALLDNIASNEPGNTVAPQLLPATETPQRIFDLVLWRVPKSTALLAQQLHRLTRCVDAGTTVLIGGMIKHLPAELRGLLDTWGEVDVLPAQKKARVFRLRRDPAKMPPLPSPSSIKVLELDLVLTADANVFARDKFDIGARFFIEQFDRLPRAQHIADLGCGNGVLGIVAQRLQPWAAMEFFDDSYQAVAAAEANYRANEPDTSQPAARFHGDAAQFHADPAQFHADDVFSEYRGAPFDLILCNPPFHQGHAIGDHIARQMFAQSRRHLRAGGELWIVGNRHLQYHAALKKIFGNCRQIAANAKFVVLAARA